MNARANCESQRRNYADGIRVQRRPESPAERNLVALRGITATEDR